jgi:hypothetical protein
VLGVKQLLAALTLRVDKATRLPLLRLYARLEAAAKKGRGRTKPAIDPEPNLRAFGIGIEALLASIDRIRGANGERSGRGHEAGLGRPHPPAPDPDRDTPCRVEPGEPPATPA